MPVIMATSFKNGKMTGLQRRIIPYEYGVFVILSGQQSCCPTFRSPFKGELKSSLILRAHLALMQVILEVLLIWRDFSPREEWCDQALGIFTGTMLTNLFT